MGIIIAILILGFLIASHEFGHLLMAKLFKIGVPEYSLGMGPKLVGKKIGDTVYNLRLIPLGGFCALEGEDDVSDSPTAFGNKSVLQRILVVVGGPLFNILTAVLLSFVLIFGAGANTPVVYQTDSEIASGLQEGDVILSINDYGITTGRDIATYQLSHGLSDEITVEFYRDGQVLTETYETSYETTRIGIQYQISEYPAEVAVVADNPAYEAGMRSGDIVTAINGVEIQSGQAMKDYFDAQDAAGVSKDAPVLFTLDRNGETIEVSVTPQLVNVTSLGFSASSFRDKTLGFGQKLYYAIQEVVSWEKYTIATVGQLVTGNMGVSDLSGPVGIVAMVSDTVETSAERYDIGVTILNIVNLVILLAVNIGVMNLLPIPALDGGRLVFLLIEVVRRKRVDPKAEAMVHAVGLGLLLLLMGFVMVQDGLRLLGVEIGM